MAEKPRGARYFRRKKAGRDGIPDPIRFLYDHGILGHINVTILHPLGLALVVEEDPRARELAVVGLADDREAPFVVLDPGQFAEYRRKFEAFLKAKGREAMELREERLGFVTQRKA